MVVTLGQQYNVVEKPTVILYTCINHHAGTPEKQQKQKQKQYSTSSNMVVMIHCYIISCKESGVGSDSFISLVTNRSGGIVHYIVGVLGSLTTRYVGHSRVTGEGPVSQLFTDTPKTFWSPVVRLTTRVSQTIA